MICGRILKGEPLIAANRPADDAAGVFYGGERELYESISRLNGYVVALINEMSVSFEQPEGDNPCGK